MSVDAGAIVDGWHGDSARTLDRGRGPGADLASWSRRPAGRCSRVSPQPVPGNILGDIAAAIEDVALAHGYGVVRSFVGHGIGTEMHEEPQVPNYRTGNRGRRIEAGLCLAIEPMFTLGGHEVRVKSDGWTVETRDGSLAAHWEHTLAVTADGPRILTVSDRARPDESPWCRRQRHMTPMLPVSWSWARLVVPCPPSGRLVHSLFACRGLPGVR